MNWGQFLSDALFGSLAYLWVVVLMIYIVLIAVLVYLDNSDDDTSVKVKGAYNAAIFALVAPYVSVLLYSAYKAKKSDVIVA